MKTMLYEAVENLPTNETTDPLEIERLIQSFDENFFAFCEKELFKINVFYEEKLAEAKRKFDTLRKEMDTIALEHYNQTNKSSAFSRLVGGSAARLLPEQATQQFRAQFHNIRSTAGTSLLNKNSLVTNSTTTGHNQHTHPRRQSLGSALTSNKTQSQIIPIKQRQKQQEFISASKKSSHPSVTTALVSTTGGKNVTIKNVSAQFEPADQLGRKSSYQPVYQNYGTLSTTSGIDRRKLNDLKLAFSEFYLSLVLLQNYQRLNFTGFRKIFKKHDKLLGNDEGKRWHQAHVETAFFHTNKDVDKLIEDTENIVTFQLESGDRQKAMKRLRVPPLNDTPQPWTAFRVGFSLGAFLVLVIAVTLTGIFQQTGDDWRIVFRLYRSSLFIIMFIFLVGVNIYGWRAHGVNHVLIFELDPRDHLGSQDLLEISFTFGLLWCISVLLFLWSGPMGIPPLLNPMILNGIMLVYLFNPTKTLHHSARTWLISCIVSTPHHGSKRKVHQFLFTLSDTLPSTLCIKPMCHLVDLRGGW